MAKKKENPALITCVFGFMFIVIGMGLDGSSGVALLLLATGLFVVAIVQSIVHGTRSAD